MQIPPRAAKLRSTMTLQIKLSSIDSIAIMRARMHCDAESSSVFSPVPPKLISQTGGRSKRLLFKPNISSSTFLMARCTM